MTTATSATVQDIIHTVFPQTTWKENPNSTKERYTTHCPLPGHDDKHASFGVHADGRRWYCWVCGGGGLVELRQRLGVIPGEEWWDRKERQTSTGKSKAKKDKPQPEGCTLAQLAVAKNLSVDFISSVLGWADSQWHGIPAVLMPYHTKDGILNRYRVREQGPDHYRWQKFAEGQSTSLYGRQCMEWVVRQGYAILVEGETDTAASLQCGIAALGVPGAQGWKAEWQEELSGLNVYAWQEPGDAGQNFVEKISRSIKGLRVIHAPPGIKDICELADQSGDGFYDAAWDLIEEATPLGWPDGFAIRERIKYYYSSHRGYSNIYRETIQTYLETLKDDLYQSYMNDGKYAEAERLAQCYETYQKYKCTMTGNHLVKRFHCGQRGCNICALWQLKRFCDGKEAILSRLQTPAVLRVFIGDQRLPADKVQRQNRITELYKEARSFTAKAMATCGQPDFVYGIRTVVRGEHFQIEAILMFDYRRGIIDELKKAYSAQTGIQTDIIELEVHGYKGASETFAAYMAAPVLWDELEDYEIWRQATKGTRFIQGKGKFHGVSAGSNPMPKKEGEGERKPDCPICGNCTPVLVGGRMPVSTTKVRAVTSPITGREYLTVAEAEPA